MHIDYTKYTLYNNKVENIIWYFIRLESINMFVKDVVVENQVGLHARPATFFIQKANEFKSSIWIEKEERRVNAKSLLGILSLGIVGGTAIRIIADGADEQAAVDGLVDLVESGFSEDAR
jgi:phosphocarrier protein